MTPLLREFVNCWLNHRRCHRALTSRIEKRRESAERFQESLVNCHECGRWWIDRRDIVNDKLVANRHRTPLHALPEVAWTGDAIGALGVVAE